MAGLTYDTAVLVGADRSDRRAWALHRRALQRGIVPTVPAGVLAQAWRSSTQAQLARLLKGCRIESLNEQRARASGIACGQAGTSDTVDAAVVVGAAARGDVIATGDISDLRRVADAIGARVSIEAI